jgi:hypothetical protein
MAENPKPTTDFNQLTLIFRLGRVISDSGARKSALPRREPC